MTTGANPTDEVSTDVVVVGHGIAGVSAAIEARRAGAEVLIVDAAGGPGGSSALSGGLLYLGGGTALQKACGVEDSVEDMAAFLTAACGPGVDTAKIEAYCDGSPEHFDWLVDCGVPFEARIWVRRTSEPWDDSGLMFTGGEDAEPFASTIRPAPRGHSPRTAGTSRTGIGGGRLLMDRLGAHAEHLGVKTAHDVSVRKLLTDDGSVIGVHGVRYGRPVRVRARRGVVLAAGSFTHDRELVAEHVPQLLGTDPLGVDEHDGTILRAATAVGAATRNLNAFEAALGVPPSVLARSIVVDRTGRRFVNEDAYMGRIGIRTLRDHDGWAAVIFDEAAFEAEPDLRRDFLPTHTGDDVDELAAELGIDPIALGRTIDRYDRDAEAGRDRDHGKRAEFLAPLAAPYGAVLAEGRFRTFTLGGLATNVDGAVLTDAGEPVPGLHAAGRITAGIAIGGYASGISLGDASFFGRRAGRTAARAVQAPAGAIA